MKLKIIQTLTFAFLAVFQVVQSQQSVAGTVTDSEGIPLPGATVNIQGTSIGASTDFDGNYQINVSQGETLIFSYVGYVEQTVNVDGATINVSLETSNDLDEVIVSGIGLTKKQRALGYNVQSVEGDEISYKQNEDFVNSLSGATSGVQITSSSGDAGSSTFMTIRGSGSVLGNNQPLYVVDGSPIISGGGFSDTGGVNFSSRSIDLNPNDIKSVKILKGGAASALYGARASNGVVLIETKSGVKGEPKIEFKTSYIMSQVSQLPERQNKYAQGNNGAWEGGFARTWGPKISELEYDGDETYKWDPYGSLVAKGTGGINGRPAKAYDAYDFFQTGVGLNNHFSISDRSGNTSYYFSISNLDKNGIIPNNTFERTTARFNGSSKYKDFLNISSSVAWTNSDEVQIQKGSNVSGIMLGLLRTPATFDNSAGYEFDDGTQRNYRNGGGYDNPYWAANNIAYERNINRVNANVALDFNLQDNLNIKYNAGLDYYNSISSNKFKIGSRDKSTGFYNESQSYNQTFNSDLVIDYKYEIDDLELGALLGYNIYSSYFKSLYGDATDLEIPDFFQLSNTSNNTTSGLKSNTRSQAFYVDFQAGYKDIVYLGLTARQEWFTTIPEANDGVIYPSASLSFVFSELNVFSDLTFLDFGKIRFSTATTANPATAYSTTNYYYPGSTSDGWTDGVEFPFKENTGFAVGGTVGNPDLKHETMKSREIGLELKLFDGLVDLDYAYFHDENSDLLMTVPVATSSGFDAIYQNAASMRKNGSELSINLNLIESQDIDWSVRANWSKIQNYVTSLAPGVDNVFIGGFTDPQVRAVAGEKYGTIFGFDWARDTNGNVLINDDPTDAYRDGYPWTDTGSMVSLGSIMPNWTANFTNNIRFKDFNLSFLIDIKNGGSMYNGSVFTMNYFGTSKVTENREVYYNEAGTIDFDRTPSENIVVIDGVYGHLDADDAVVSDGTKNVTPVVLDEEWFEGYGGNFGGGPTALAVEPTDWVRLRDITLSYNIKNLPEFFDSAQVYFSGKNLWLDTPYSGIDPETSLTGSGNSQGFDYFNSPGSKSYTIGLNLSF
jgi:TonB-linked SusC/RagA family outer membrane protein